MSKVFPLTLIGAGLFLLLAGIGYWRFEAAIQSPSSAPLPQQVTNLPLTVKLSGLRAEEEVAHLHQKSFPLTSAAVGTYGSENQVILWVSGAPITPLTTRMLASMRDKIAAGGSPFTPLGERKDGSRTIYELNGMGQLHFYFQSGKLLVWMAATPELAEQALREVLKFYP